MVIARLVPSVDRSEEYVQQFRDNTPIKAFVEGAKVKTHFIPF